MKKIGSYLNQTNSVIIILAYCLLLYGNTVFHDFTLDDRIVITENSLTQQGISGIPALFAKDSFFGYFNDETKATLVAGGRYRPMTLAWFALVGQLVGNNPFYFHLFQLIFYSLLCILLYYTLRMIFQKSSKLKPLFTLVVVLLFAAHPIHTEVVANIKGLDEIFSLIGGLSALFFSLKFVKTKGYIYLIGTFLSLLFGLLSKENSIAFVAIIPFTLYFFDSKKQWQKIIYPTLSLMVAAIIYLTIRANIIGWSVEHNAMEMMNNPFIKVVDGQYLPFSVSEQIATILYGWGKYIQLLCFPHPLTHDYYPRAFEVFTMKSPAVWLSIIMLIMLFGIAVVGWKKRSNITYGIVFFITTLLLMSNIFFPIGTHLSERFLFTPSLGWAIVAAHLFFGHSRGNRIVKWGIMLIVLLLFSWKTIDRNTVWKDNYTLFSTDVRISKNSAKANNAAGGALTERAQSLDNNIDKQEMLIRAQAFLQKAIEIHPKYKDAYLILGNNFFYQEKYPDAISTYESALKVDPSFKDARDNLFLAYRNGGRYAGEKLGNIELALSYLRKSYKMEPTDYETLRLLAISHGNNGQHALAINYFEKAVAVQPDLAQSYVNLAYAYANFGDDENARINYEKAVRIDPNALNKQQ